MKKTNNLIMLIPAFWSCVFDFLITIFNQPSEYWNGNLETYIEGNPIVAYLMRNNTSGIFIFVIVWLSLIGIIGYFLPPKLLRIFSLFVVIAHTWGASAWVEYCFGFWFVLILVLLNAIIFIFVQDFYFNRITKSLKTNNKT